MKRLVDFVFLAAAVCVAFDGQGQTVLDPPAAGRVISYDEALALVIQNSYELKLADEDIRDARRRVSRAKRQYHPRLKVQGTARGDLLELDHWTSDQNVGAGMVLDWSPYRNGELLRESTMSRMGLTVATLSRRQASIDLEYEFRQAYYELLKQIDAVELAKQRRDLAEQKVIGLRQDAESGAATKAELLEEEGRFLEADVDWQRSRQQLEMSLIQLQQRTGWEAIETVGDVDRTIEPVGDLTVDDCLSAAMGVRISVLIGREQVRSADLGVRYAKLKRLPSVYFFTGSDYALTQDVGGDEFELRAGVTISYPIYGAGDTAAAIADAKAAAVRARIQDAQMRLRVEQEVRTAYWAYVNTVRLLESTREREQVFEDSFEEARVLHERGAMSEIEYATAQIRYTESRTRVRTLELDALLAGASLAKAVGVNDLIDVPRSSDATGTEPASGTAAAQKEAS